MEDLINWIGNNLTPLAILISASVAAIIAIASIYNIQRENRIERTLSAVAKMNNQFYGCIRYVLKMQDHCDKNNITKDNKSSGEIIKEIDKTLKNDEVIKLIRFYMEWDGIARGRHFNIYDKKVLDTELKTIALTSCDKEKDVIMYAMTKEYAFGHINQWIAELKNNKA